MIRKLIATLLLAALPVMPALAGKPDKSNKGSGNGHSNSNGQGKGHKNDSKHGGGGGQSWGNEHDDNDHSARFSNNDRDHWRNYWRDQYEHGNCPPGLAKKHNGCMPPGQAKKRYRVGYPLPPDVIVVAVPVLILPQLSPLPSGYRYGMIDGDLVKLAVGTMLVVDAIDGLTN